jgi:hypothetical protein
MHVLRLSCIACHKEITQNTFGRHLKTACVGIPIEDYKLLEYWERKKRCHPLLKVTDRNGHPVQFLLTYKELTHLAEEAGIDGSQIGTAAESYCLARHDDLGDYTVDNCRFITQSQNSKERDPAYQKTPEHRKKLSDGQLARFKRLRQNA